MKKKAPTTNTKQSKTPKPEKKWQTGAYSRHADYHFCLPYPFLLLCRLTDQNPQTILIDFMDNLACAAWNRAGRDEVKQQLINYFITHGYGQQHYTIEELQQMFKEMDAIGLLFPKHGKSKTIDAYVSFRDRYYNHWFKKWFRKPRRKP
jgi:hypothetical protein